MKVGKSSRERMNEYVSGVKELVVDDDVDVRKLM